MIPTLPAELTDRIIDFLHADKDALLPCSLVCKAWLPSSRYHCSLSISSRNVDSFVELLTTPISTIGKHAHYLEIQSSTTILLKIAPYLSSFATRSLALRDETLGPRYQPGENELKWFAQLRDVDIENALFFTTVQFFAFLASLHSLETLAVRLPFPVTYSSNPGTSDAEHINAFTFPSLRSIRIWLPGSVPRLSWFVSVAQIPSVTSLTICNIIKNDDHHAVRNLLLSLGSSVQTLHLEFESSLGAFGSLVIGPLFLTILFRNNL
jgi:hypothetical protein